MGLFGRQPVVMPVIEEGLVALGYTPDDFRISTEHAGDRVAFVAKQRGLTLRGIVSESHDGWVRISVSPITPVGEFQSRTTTLPPKMGGWYE